jgi:hypothetical protein
MSYKDRLAGTRLNPAIESANSGLYYVLKCENESIDRSPPIKRQQIRRSMEGAHYLLQTRGELLDGRLGPCFLKRFPHFRSPGVVRC